MNTRPGARVTWSQHGHIRMGRYDRADGRYAVVTCGGRVVRVHADKLHTVDSAPYEMNARRSL